MNCNPGNHDEGICIKEGNLIFPESGSNCCNGLTNIENYQPKSVVKGNGETSDAVECEINRIDEGLCIKCGDGQCGFGENICNCPQDCEPEFVCNQENVGRGYCSNDFFFTKS